MKSNNHSQDRPNDRELLRMAVNGDSAAFEIFYDRHSTAIFNYLLRLIHERGPAEELLQEVFLAAWQGASRFQGRSTVKTWLFRIAHNQSVSWLRKHTRGEQPTPIESELSETLSGDEISPEDFSFQNWQANQIIQALDHLSETHRAVIELSFVQEFSHKEIAQIMDCPSGTVKSRLSYALKHLEGILKQMGIE